MRERVTSFHDRYSSLAGSITLMRSNPEIWSGLQAAVCRLSSHSPMTEIAASDKDELCLHLQGGVHLQRYANGQKQTEYSSSGGLCLNPKRTTIKYAWDGDVPTTMHLYLSPSLLQQTIAQVSAIDPVRVELISRFNVCDPLIYQLMLAMYAELETGGLFGQSYIEALGNALVLRLLRHYASIPLQPSLPAGRLSGQQIRQVRDYINDHLTQGVSLADMATSLGLSVSYFTHLFKEATGLSPYQYVIQCRIERAKHLLLDSTLTIAQVAQRVGFTDQSHLNRHLKRSLGVTPGYLRGERKNIQKE
jgi:AraC family transcriptional regulator